MSFEITNSAKKELIKFSNEELYDNEMIRITRNFKCGDSRFKIIVDEVLTKMDETLEFENFKIIINKSELEFLKDTILDFNEDGFIFNEMNLSC